MYNITLYLLLGLSILVFIFIILTIINITKLNKISKNSKNGDLASSIDSYYNKVDSLTNNINDISNRFKFYENEIKKPLKKIGLIHFNAFDNISGNLSFSLCSLNEYDDGYIITSLYGHDSTSIYLREIKNGKPNVTISEEEINSLNRALNS